ncbi:unnamed protein product [Debaryomyces tyrocola]|nr:unnamed protein product [Debaryomyces tyrocola]
MLIYKIFDYISLKLLGRIEKFIKDLNARLLRESNIKLIANSDNTETTLLNNIIHTTEDIEREYLLDTDLDAIAYDVDHGNTYYTEEDGMNLFDGFFENSPGDNTWCCLSISGYNNVPIQNIFTALSLAVFTVLFGSLMYFVIEYLIPRKLSAGKLDYTSWNSSLQNGLHAQRDDLSVSALIDTYASRPNSQSNSKFLVHVEANAQIPYSLSKQTGDLQLNNLNFLSYDFIIDDYMGGNLVDNMDELDVKYMASEMPVDKSNIAPIIKPKLKEVRYASKQVRSEHEGSSSETLFPHNISQFEYICPHLEDSSLSSADSSSPQTIESDIQNNSIVTDDEFEIGQQNCLQNLLHLYNETHTTTIPCFPITIQSRYNGDISCHERRDTKQRCSSQEETSQITTESDFNELEYIAMYEKCGYNKRNIKPFTKLSRTKYSPLYNVPKFVLSQTTVPLISNENLDPSVFFDLYDYLSLLDISDRQESLRILSDKYHNNSQQVMKLIEFEILNLCSTSNEFEIQDIVKTLQYIISSEYDGDNPNISKIIQMYNNSLKRHIHDLLALLRTPFAEKIVVLLCDYLSFADNNKVDIETYNNCLETIIESTEFNKEAYKTISNSACIMVCALDFTMLPYTFFVIFDHIFMDEKYKPSKQITALKCLKYYICFNKLSIIDELTANPMENKVKCCGYQLVNLLLSNILKIICISRRSNIPKKVTSSPKYSNSASTNTNIDPLILELIDTYLVIVEIFLNNDKIPSAIQYELLSSFITKIYTQIKPFVENDLRTLDPPILKELQIHFDLTQ